MRNLRKTVAVQMFMMIALVMVMTFTAMARDLKTGMRGEDVRRWQVFLIARNFDLPADGYYGPVTRRATTTFQKKWKLYVDGVVGKQTMRRAKQLGYDRIVGLGSGSSAGGTSRLSEQFIRSRVLAYLSDTLHDPYSARVVRWGKVYFDPDADIYRVQFRFRAKNRLGAYGLSDRLFSLDADGNVLNSVELD